MYRLLLTFLIALIIVLPTQSLFAASTERERLLSELHTLLTQLAELQALLAERQRAQVLGASIRRLEPSRYYRGEYEVIYTVSGISLTPYGSTIANSADMLIWNVVLDTFGERIIRKHITEFRVYRDSWNEYDAFVEQLEDDDWIVGVNLAGVDLSTRGGETAATGLFVHELAHILYHYEYEVARDFDKEFWQRQSRNRDDYVSDYAMKGKEEDFAESFMYFVLYGTGSRDDQADEKVDFFSDYDYFRVIRAGIRERILY